MTNNSTHYYIDGKKLDIDEIEDILSQIMTDEFNTTLEDDSPYLVAKHLVLLFNQCVNGNFTEVERLREKAKTQNAFVASTCVKQGDDDDDDESGDDDQEGSRDNKNNDDGDATMDDVPEEPTVDADGWEIVRRK
jgi:pre-rRNA-processing protein TSR2